MQELKPCPFCGESAYIDSCDRLIHIGCKRCNYNMTFWGLLTPEPHKVVASHPDSKVKEYYNPNAYEDAAEVWNRRV